MRFLVDENLPVDIARLLQDQGHDVLYVPQSTHRGSTDRAIWQLAAREERIVITRDLDFPLADVPRPPGVTLIRVPDTFTRQQIAGVMAEFLRARKVEQMAGAVTVVSPGRVRARKL